MDLTINPEFSHIKYADFFLKSKKFETRKVDIAKKILEEYPDYGASNICFIASKHAIQASLAMKGVGYSSKVGMLLPLAEKYLGKNIANSFRKLFNLYVKSEYELKFLTKKEEKRAVSYVETIMKVYSKKS